VGSGCVAYEKNAEKFAAGLIKGRNMKSRSISSGFFIAIAVFRGLFRRPAILRVPVGGHLLAWNSGFLCRSYLWRVLFGSATG
jgi:hypothetical protein